jgi:GNAT superfamily N-acetyltransferase
VTRDEIREIAAIVGGDKTYAHFVHRINKEFEISDEERNSHVYVLFQEDAEKGRVGFCVIGHSPAKMDVWGKTFKEEGWVEKDFKMRKPSFELMYLYIKPEIRIRGNGTRLFRRALAFARERQVKAIYAYVSDRNPSALNFYRKMKGRVLHDFSGEGLSAAFLEWRL